MKKLLNCLLIFVLLTMSVASLGGCGNSKIKVSIGMWPDSSQLSDVAMFSAWKAAFERDNPEYEIVPAPYVYSPDTFISKAASGQLPTVFQTYFTEPQMMIAGHYIKDITDNLESLGWLEHMDIAMRAAVEKNGRVYGVPRDGYGLGLFLNLDMLHGIGEIEKDEERGKYILHDESGKPLYPTTFEDLERVSRLVTEMYDGAYGMVILSANKNGGWQFTNLAWNFGAGSFQTESGGKWTAHLNDPKAVEALSWIQNMAQEELIYPSASLEYVDWYAKIGSKNVAMAFAGSDALALPVTNYDFNKDDIAFVPMPSVEGVKAKALFGGTPYVFAANATSEQVEGALKFLHYMGRSPVVDDISKAAALQGFNLSRQKGMPIMPTLKPWTNEEYLTYINGLEKEYINVNMDYYNDFFDTIYDMRRWEDPNSTQEMYRLLDTALQDLLSNKATANPQSLLGTANATFQRDYLDKIK